MALELNLSYARATDKLSIIVTDNTGTGATGYGGSNPSVTDFTDFNITITPADPVTYLPTGTPVTVNAYPSLPSVSGGTFTIANTDLGLTATEEIGDGVYLFEVSANWNTGGDEGVASATNRKIFYETTACCIQNLTWNLVGCGCSGNSVKVQNIVKANVLLLQLKPTVNSIGEVDLSPAEECERWNDAAEILRELNKICNNSNCGGCGGC